MSDNKININWYPGHMTKAKRMMEGNIKLIDLIIEMRFHNFIVWLLIIFLTVILQHLFYSQYSPLFFFYSGCTHSRQNFPPSIFAPHSVQNLGAGFSFSVPGVFPIEPVMAFTAATPTMAPALFADALVSACACALPIDALSISGSLYTAVSWISFITALSFPVILKDVRPKDTSSTPLKS